MLKHLALDFCKSYQSLLLKKKGVHPCTQLLWKLGTQDELSYCGLAFTVSVMPDEAL